VLRHIFVYSCPFLFYLFQVTYQTPSVSWGDTTVIEPKRPGVPVSKSARLIDLSSRSTDAARGQWLEGEKNVIRGWGGNARAQSPPARRPGPKDPATRTGDRSILEENGGKEKGPRG